MLWLLINLIILKTVVTEDLRFFWMWLARDWYHGFGFLTVSHESLSSWCLLGPLSFSQTCVLCIINPHISQQMEHSVNQSYYPWVNCQESVVQNRLPLLWHEFLRWISNSGVASILICLHFSIIGLFALSLLSYERPSLWYNIAHYLFSCGTFGFTGGCVNYLAVTLFYKKIPGLYGTG